jgi:transcriptional regulator with XRE-family HTH domain
MKKLIPLDMIRGRLESGKTQAEVAKELGVSTPYLSDILKGKRDCGPKVLRALGLERVTVYREAAE